MLEIHKRLHALRSTGGVADPLPIIAKQFVTEQARILCLDEFQVTDVADAMILKRLFESIWQQGCIVVATSNRAPEDLYFNGINRPVFLPFIDTLKQYCDVHLIGSGQDHRLLGTIADGVYHTPINVKTDAIMEKTFQTLSDGFPIETGNTARNINVLMGNPHINIQ